MKLEIKPKQIAYPNGLEIAVEGFAGDGGVRPAQVFMEVYEGKIRVHVWAGESEDPTVTVEVLPEPRSSVQGESTSS